MVETIEKPRATDNVRLIPFPDSTDANADPRESDDQKAVHLGQDGATKRIGVKLPLREHDEYQRIAKLKRVTMSDFVRAALQTAKKIALEKRNGNSILVVDSNGKVLEEIGVSITLF